MHRVLGPILFLVSLGAACIPEDPPSAADETPLDAVAREDAAPATNPRSSDAGTSVVQGDAGRAAPPAASRCSELRLAEVRRTNDSLVNLLATVLPAVKDDLEALYCPFEERSYDVPSPLGLRSRRTVYFQTPLGTPPSGGWPVVVVFQPTAYVAPLHWIGVKGVFDSPIATTVIDRIRASGGQVSDGEPSILGQYYPTRMIQRLLDSGYAVLTPYAELADGTVWQTNVPLVDQSFGGWDDSKDGNLMETIFAAVDRGDFGPLDGSTMFATGMSSGGYMTSRVALEYPERFRAVAVQSGAWATCLGPLCFAKSRTVLGAVYDGRQFSLYPTSMPDDHPPTLFIHGVADFVVPLSSMEAYENALRAQGTETRKVVVEHGDFGGVASHFFFSVTPDEVVNWFDAHR